jgi:hypothetical protein
VVVYGSVHFKSQKQGGVAVHGWPDPDYFKNINSELDGLGVPK